MLLFSDNWPWRNEKNHARAIRHSANNHNVKEMATEILEEILPYTSARLEKRRANHYREFWSGELQQIKPVRRRALRNKKDTDAHEQVS